MNSLKKMRVEYKLNNDLGVVSKYSLKQERLIPILLEHSLINEDLDFFDDYLVGGDDGA